MFHLIDQLFQLKVKFSFIKGERKLHLNLTLTLLYQFTAKQLNKQSKRCQKDETIEKNKLKKAIQDGNMEGARIYASNAIRKKNEALNLLKLSSRIDAVASRVQTAITMRKVSNSMAMVVRGMGRAMETMNLEQVM